MSLSVIIDTAAGITENTISSGKVPYRDRAYALRSWVLPLYIQNPYIDQLIVVGVWEEGDGYEYVHCPASKHGNGVDALVQRQAGFERATGDVLVFQHDDHFLDMYTHHRETGKAGPSWFLPVINQGTPEMSLFLEREKQHVGWQVLSPSRYTRLRNVSGERLNDGSRDGYINGHCAIYRREVIERCPWNGLPEKFIWDVLHTQQIREAGFKIEWTDAIKVWDIEAGARPWV